jgi:hypothetical protein
MDHVDAKVGSRGTRKSMILVRFGLAAIFIGSRSPQVRQNRRSLKALPR